MEQWQNTYANAGLTPTIPPPVGIPSIGPASWWELEKLLPMELIRQHTKTDDIPSVSDVQLNLYRKAALEAAEQYTGFFLSGQKSQIESVERKPQSKWRGQFTFYTKYPVADGIIYFYGSHRQLADRTIMITPGTRKVMIPVMHAVLDTRSCCDPCANPNTVNWGMKILYRAGFASCDGIPAGILLGMLKYVAWSIRNAGDEFLSVRNRDRQQNDNITGTNNVAWASGALELWRQYDPEAI